MHRTKNRSEVFPTAARPRLLRRFRRDRQFIDRVEEEAVIPEVAKAFQARRPNCMKLRKSQFGLPFFDSG